VRHHWWILVGTTAIAACSLAYDLDDYGAKIVFVGPDASTGEGGSLAPGGDAGGRDAGQTPTGFCEGALFCSTFATPTLVPEWGQAIAYGGGLAPVLGSTALSPPRGVDLRKPQGPAGGGTLTLILPRAGATPIAAELAVRFASIGNGASILKLGLGSSAVGLSVHPTTLDVVGDTTTGGGLHAPLIARSLPLHTWVRLRLELYPGVQNTATLLVDGEAVLTRGAIGDRPFGTDITIELGLVFVGENEPEVAYSLDDVAIRPL
jgi:hypothetical protein